MLEITKPAEYLLEKIDVPKKIYAYVRNKIFLNKLIESQKYYYKKHSFENKWVSTNHGFSILLNLPSIYDEDKGQLPKIYVKSNSKTIDYIKLLIKVYTKNDVKQDVIELYDIGNKPVSKKLIEVPYRQINFENETNSFPYNYIEIYMINDKKTFINYFYPTNFDLLNYRYIYFNGSYWNSMLIEREMEEIFCKNPKCIIDRKIFEILCKKEYNSFLYKFISFLYWIKVVTKSTVT
ncbi:hypothetical protein R84B8_00068 [Treponema sp. R8-4-B8]